MLEYVRIECSTREINGTEYWCLCARVVRICLRHLHLGICTTTNRSAQMWCKPKIIDWLIRTIDIVKCTKFGDWTPDTLA